MYFAVEASLNEIEQFMEQMPFATLLLNEREEIVAVNELFLQVVKCDYAQVKHAPLHQFVLFEDKDSTVCKKFVSFPRRRAHHPGTRTPFK